MTAVPAERSHERVSRIVIAVVGAVAVAVILLGLVWRLRDRSFGTATSPFVSGWLPQVDPVGAAFAVAAGVVLVLTGPRLAAVRWSPPAIALALYVLALGTGLAMNVAREGITGWTHIFDLEGGTSQSHAINEYLPGLPTLENGIANYLDRFAEVVPSQSVNVAGHPPGPLILATWLGATTAGSLAALVILIGTLCAPLTYRLAWTLSGDETIGRVAGLLCAASPLTLLVGVTSFDYAYAAFGALAACGLVARSWRWRTFGLAAFAVASMMTWALLGVGAWAALVVWQRDGWRKAAVIAALSGASVALLQGALAARYGYDPIGTLRATEQVYRDSLAQVRPYWFWLLGSPVAWGVMLGPVIVAAVLRGVVARRDAAVAVAAVVAIAAIGGFTKAETERIWLFLVPLACAAAAPYLRRPLRPVLAFLVAQALVVQLLMNTVW
ncbi:MAG: hypothetical protein JHD16_14505 [Solirubrobacteraceae bacterium]|nr:hypothetical protein [Solirubrobacteraceae bacterium]